MQLAIELPDELGKKLLQQTSVNEFVQEAIKKLLQEQKQLNLEEKIIAAKKGYSPITQSFIGVLAGSNFDESDYKKHLADKYL
jgi:methionine synthase II (cobalamin-independent)